MWLLMMRFQLVGHRAVTLPFPIVILWPFVFVALLVHAVFGPAGRMALRWQAFLTIGRALRALGGMQITVSALRTRIDLRFI